jgi:hypothetical protein
MRLFLAATSLLLLTAAMTGCSKSPADSNPPGVVANPNRPDPEAIKQRKLNLIDPPKGGATAPAHGNR